MFRSGTDSDAADRKLHSLNSFEQTEAFATELAEGPIGAAAMRVLIRHRQEIAIATLPWLENELALREQTDQRAFGEAAAAVLSRWVKREWPRLSAEIARELDADGTAAGA